MASEFIKRQKHDILRDISAFGSLFCYLFLLVITLILGKYDLFARMGFGLVLIYAVTVIIRTFYFKDRPNKFSHNTYIERLDAASFPSLHSSRAAFLGLTLSRYFGNYIFTIIAIILALSIAYTRIYLKKHDFMDVSGGIILGVFVYFGVNFIVG